MLLQPFGDGLVNENADGAAGSSGQVIILGRHNVEHLRYVGDPLGDRVIADGMQPLLIHSLIAKRMMREELQDFLSVILRMMSYCSDGIETATQLYLRKEEAGMLDNSLLICKQPSKCWAVLLGNTKDQSCRSSSA